MVPLQESVCFPMGACDSASAFVLILPVRWSILTFSSWIAIPHLANLPDGCVVSCSQTTFFFYIRMGKFEGLMVSINITMVPIYVGSEMFYTPYNPKTLKLSDPIIFS